MSEAREKVNGTLADTLDDGPFTRLVSLRRWFHRHPEIVFEEANTAERIIVELDRLGVA